MKQPKVYIKEIGIIAEATMIDYFDEEVEVYDEDESRYHYCDFDEVEFIYGTGFKDKNGKEIESGDILKIDFADIISIKFHSVYGFYAIDKDDKYWFAEELEDEFRETFSKSEVIGNIYENKDLLEG
ncbi:YopX family protein [Gemella haemolysans]|uniref:YopX family protein n=1 Tax=Gemella haemolysans TaxID=1379 RepID=UPI0019591376|nr:YopX family protein [Gemella haemolysans]VTX71410.1 YopX protein [Gemella haemolysans]